MGTGAAAGASISGGASLVATGAVVILPPALRALARSGAFSLKKLLPRNLAGMMTFYEGARELGAREARSRTRYLLGLMRMGWRMQVMQQCSWGCDVKGLEPVSTAWRAGYE